MQHPMGSPDRDVGGPEEPDDLFRLLEASDDST